MTKKEDVKKYITTKVFYDTIQGEYMMSKWITPKDIEIVKALQSEIPSIYVDEKNGRFRLRTKICK
jgi:hypothetical protein